ncbi:MAG: hypothetical protein ACYDC2_07725 [Solirubrobacteraceae bacterium]
MTRSKSFIAALAAVAAVGLAGPVAGAGASAAGIKHALKTYSGRILVAEAHVVSAEESYRTSHNAAPVLTAIEAAVKVLGEMRTAVQHQPASRPKIKQAKRLIVTGLGDVMSAYTKLKTAFAVKAVNEAAAKAEAEKAVTAAKTAKSDLKKAAKLLR